MEIIEAFAHLGSAHPESEEDTRYIAREAMPHYLWMWGDTKHRKGYCTGCFHLVEKEATAFIPSEGTEEDFDRPHQAMALKNDWQHKHFGICPGCGRVVQYRHIGRSHTGMQDDCFLVMYQKSVLDPRHTVVMTGYDVRIDYRHAQLNFIEQYGDFYEDCEALDGEMQISLREVCVFRAAGGMEKAGAWRFLKKSFWTADYLPEQERAINIRQVEMPWERMTKCLPGFRARRGTYGTGGQDVICYLPAFREATAGTAFAAAETIGNNYIDRIDVMRLIAMSPCVEYMAKLGWTRICRNILAGDGTWVLNLRGKKPEKVLRTRKAFYDWLKGNRIEPDLPLIRAAQAAEKRGLPIGYPKILKLVRELRVNSYRARDNSYREGLDGLMWDLEFDFPEIPALKALKYMLKKNVPVSDYMDQLRMLRRLQTPLTDEWAFPNDFARAHEETSRRYNAAQNSRHDRAIQERAEAALSAYQFSAMGYTMRPFLNGQEIIDEGNRQHICIGSYVERYAKGGTILCCIRRDEALNAPFAAVEFTTKGELVQCRGFRNREPDFKDGEKEAFFRLFEMSRAQYTKQNNQKKGRAA